MFSRLYMALSLALAVAAAPAVALDTRQPGAKLSRNNICHPLGSDGYAKTKTFTPYPTLEACLEHGRLPKGQSAPATSTPRYDREAFGGWLDQDGDCLNTRHAVLRDLSTAAVALKGRCRVERGRWLDPYTGKIFTRATDVDIDHIVPLAYAWPRGAAGWPQRKREDFANDPANLLAVDRATNRDKGAKGPTEWLPPDATFHCQYVLRFQRISKTYQLVFSASETRALADLQKRLCQAGS